MDEQVAPKWQSMIWLGLGVALAVLLIALLLLVTLTQLITLDVIAREHQDKAFITTTLTSANLILLRLIVVLIGGSISLAGLAVSFFTHEHATEIAGGRDVPTAPGPIAPAPTIPMPPFRLISHSPGVVAMVIGAVVIVCALFRETVGEYESKQIPPTVNSEKYEKSELKEPP